VSFALGFSLSFERALLEQGLELRHLTRGCNVSRYRTKVPTQETSQLHGQLVVSMRPFTPADPIWAIQVTSRFPEVHGAPVHSGDPSLLIGIKDLGKPDYGDAADIKEDEFPSSGLAVSRRNRCSWQACLYSASPVGQVQRQISCWGLI